MKHQHFLRRVVLRDYKSIGACDVRLGMLTFLVGANGAGKSNFLDALRFVADALNTSLDNALQERGGLPNILRDCRPYPQQFGIRLEFQSDDDWIGHYAFAIGTTEGRSWGVRTEELRAEKAGQKIYFKAHLGVIETCSENFSPAVTPDRLALVAFSGLLAFRPIFDALTAMGFYDFDPGKIREIQAHQDGRILKSAGENIASVFGRLEKSGGQTLRQVRKYLSLVVPAVHDVSRVEIGHMETLGFELEISGSEKHGSFPAFGMSDGTLRALGILVALFQGEPQHRITLVGIEEPETALHPAASAALREAMFVASRQTQIIITSHSPELLDDYDIPPDAIYAVLSKSGTSTIAPIDKASRSAVKDHLFSVGELLRLNQLAQDDSALVEQSRHQPALFGDNESRN